MKRACARFLIVLGIVAVLVAHPRLVNRVRAPRAVAPQIAAAGGPDAAFQQFFPIIRSVYPSPILFVSNRRGRFDIAGVAPDGGQLLFLTDTPDRDEIDPAWSPPKPADAADLKRRIAFASNLYGQFEIYTMRADGSAPVRLTYNNATDVSPTWSPDGSKIAYASDISGTFHIFAMNADGSGRKAVTMNPAGGQASDRSPQWSPTLDKIAFVSNRDGHDEIYIVSPDGTGPTRLTNGDQDNFDPRWSPDGTLAFASARDGRFEIYTMNADGTGQTRLTQNAGINTSPAWSPDGQSIVFMSTRDSPSSFVNPELYVMDRAGTNVRRLFQDELGADDWQPAWWR